MASRGVQLLRRARGLRGISRHFGCSTARVSGVAFSRILATPSTIGSQTLEKSRFQHTQVRSTESSVGGCQVRAVDTDDDKRHLCVTFSDGKSGRFPYVYLRDNCQCPECWHPSTLSRRILMMDLDVNIKPKEAKVVNDGTGIEMTWPDGHVSPYPADWLEERNFADETRQRRDAAYGQKHQMWGREMNDKLQRFNFNDILNNDRVFLNWLLEMERHGLTLIKNAPCEIGQLEKIGERVSFLRTTNYGNTFVVKSKQDPSNLAYTKAKLGLHCDLPFYQYVPSLQMLHCVHNTSKGGENQFADASYAAVQLREKRPDLYKILTDTLVDFYDMGNDYYKFHKVHRHPIIKLDYEGNVIGIHYNNAVRDSFLNIPLDKVQPLYEGMKMMDDIMYHTKNVVKLTLEAGDIIVFDNIRILHGRDEYKTGEKGERFLQGAYMDWDVVKSRIRVLKEELGVKS